MARGEEADDMVDVADMTGRERRARTGANAGANADERKGASTGASTGGSVHGPLLSIAVDLVLPLLVYYAARALGAGQGPALLLSGAPPALRLVTGAVRQRRIDGVDLFFTVLLAAAALTTLIGGSTRILLFKDAALSLVVGGWVLGTGFTGRPLAFQLGQRLHRGPAARIRAGMWQDFAEFRRGLRVLTVVWGAEQLLDGGIGALAAATLPTDVVPLLGRVLSFLLLALAAAVTAAYARRFRTRHGLPLFGAPGTGGGAGDPSEGRQAAPNGAIRTPASPASPDRRPSRAGGRAARPAAGTVGDVGWSPCTRSGRPG
ncbi:VC0807 family protein [Streptomyces sp. NPDC007205]|uniref:VC0807 family protein n=1 Tax=Streptomyces sp. NPDC007205 TaxID=3154316 RepID=UPI0033D2003F